MTDRTPDLSSDIGDVLVSEAEIAAKVTELGARIAADYRGRPITLVSVLKGSLPFMADLMRAIDLPLRIDLMEVSSYGGSATESSGLVRILKDLSASIEGEDVLIVEDIIDTGLTLNYLIRYLRGKNPASLRICTLLDKPARRLVEIPVDYIGFTIPDQFVVGYGLDYGELLPQPPIRRGPATGGLWLGRGDRRRRDVTMHRRPLGQGRTLAALGGGLIVIGSVLPWWQVGGDGGAPCGERQRPRGQRHRRVPRRRGNARTRRPALRGGRPAHLDRSMAVVRGSWPSWDGWASAGGSST